MYELKAIDPALPDWMRDVTLLDLRLGAMIASNRYIGSLLAYQRS